MPRLPSLATVLLLALVPAPVLADEIKVSPGPDAITKALASAKKGDVVKIAPGAYTESVELPADVTLEGAGADQTTLTATAYAAINCRGARVRIVGLTIKAAGGTVRGVNSSLPVRVERCRFVGIKEGVALMSAPLSDVIACDFIDCGIGVRAIGGACPTVWGCAFEGGNMGVFAMDGSPYIRNNLFRSTKCGIRMAPHSIQSPTIRNNVFAKCPDGAIMLLPGRDSFAGPSIRNCVFLESGAAVIGPPELVTTTSHCIMHGVTAPAFRTDSGAETTPGKPIADANPGITITDARAVVIANADLLDGKGVRLCSDAEDAVGTIGLEKDWRTVGVHATGALPPIRFAGPRYIANSVAEEYQYLAVLNRRRAQQSMGNVGGVPVDTHTPGDGVEPAEIPFDISRFFGETSIGR